MNDKIFNDWIDEMYQMEKGAPILRPNEELRFGDARITRKEAKHIIEQRKDEGKSPASIKKLFAYIPEAVMDPDLELPNPNPRHKRSTLRIKILAKGEGIIAVVSKEKDGCKDIITAFTRDPRGIKRLNQKLQESASGETPRP